jgi:hypothetical protein
MAAAIRRMLVSMRDQQEGRRLLSDGCSCWISRPGRQSAGMSMEILYPLQLGPLPLLVR